MKRLKRIPRKTESFNFSPFPRKEMLLSSFKPSDGHPKRTTY